MTDHDPLDDRPTEDVTLTDPDGKLVAVGGATIRDQQAKVAELKAQWGNRRGLAAFWADFNADVDRLDANHWDFLDAYSDRMWPGQNASPGADWPLFPPDPSPTTLAQAVTWVNRKMAVVDDRQSIIRSQLSWVTYAQTREAHLLRLLGSVLARQMERDPTLVPPPR